MRVSLLYPCSFSIKNRGKVPLLLSFEKNLGNSEKNILYLLPSPHTLALKFLDKFLEFGIGFWCRSMKLAEHV